MAFQIEFSSLSFFLPPVHGPRSPVLPLRPADNSGAVNGIAYFYAQLHVIMKKFLGLSLAVLLTGAAFAQDSTATTYSSPAPKRVNPINLTNRANDHLMIQLSSDGWANKPDTAKFKGISRGFNLYFMYDMPFKSAPNFSVALGVGFSTSNIYFDETYIDIAGKTKTQLDFADVSDTTHYKKYKLLTSYLEAPVELRYLFNPENSNKSWKIALGVKIGTLLAASTKGKSVLNSADQATLNIVQKEKSKRFFNGTRISGTARVGYGALGIFASYQLNNFIKEGFGPNIRPYQIGITISGL